jgi:hypothetical protein
MPCSTQLPSNDIWNVISASASEAILRHDEGLRRWIEPAMFDCDDNGSTAVKLKRNPNPTRIDFDLALDFGRRAYLLQPKW